MQYMLEYFLRIADDLPDVYYVNNSFRGEDSDAMHLNQFYHVECELLGGFSAGISVAEKYIIYLVSAFLRDYQEPIGATAGSTDRLENLLRWYRSNVAKFPQVTVEDPLDPPGVDSTCRKYIVTSDRRKGRTITRTGGQKLINYFGGAVWLIELDHLSVPFYQAYTDDSCTKARCADLLLGNGEVLGLGERHMLAKDGLAAPRQHKFPMEPYAWYRS